MVLVVLATDVSLQGHSQHRPDNRVHTLRETARLAEAAGMNRRRIHVDPPGGYAPDYQPPPEQERPIESAVREIPRYVPTKSGNCTICGLRDAEAWTSNNVAYCRECVVAFWQDCERRGDPMGGCVIFTGKRGERIRNFS